MRIEKTSCKTKDGRVITTIHYYSDAGRELAFFGGSSKILYINSDVLKRIDNRPDYVSHAKDEYKADLEAIAALYPDAPRSEYLNA